MLAQEECAALYPHINGILPVYKRHIQGQYMKILAKVVNSTCCICKTSTFEYAVLDVRDYYMLCYIYYIQVLLVSDNARCC